MEDEDEEEEQEGIGMGMRMLVLVLVWVLARVLGGGWCWWCWWCWAAVVSSAGGVFAVSFILP